MRVSDLLVLFAAGGEDRGEGRVDVFDVPVAERSRHALAVAVGVETDVLAVDVVADVVRLVRDRCDTEKLAVELLGCSQVLHGVQVVLMPTNSTS